jgi:hypothetical protein
MHGTSYMEFSAEELNAARQLLLDRVVEYFLRSKVLKFYLFKVPWHQIQQMSFQILTFGL